jgi:hypothetical protein
MDASLGSGGGPEARAGSTVSIGATSATAEVNNASRKAVLRGFRRSKAELSSSAARGRTADHRALTRREH